MFINKNMMIVHDEHTGKIHHFICTGDKCKPKPNEKIPFFYSFLHAADNGWRYYAYFEDDVNVMCPDCVAVIGDRNEN